MRRTCYLIPALLAALPLSADETALRPELAPLAFVVGHCWAGEFPDNGGTDRHCFEPVFGGVHIRDVHVLESGRGPYQGETLFSWDAEAKTIRYVYLNSLGGVSFGTAEPDGDTLRFPDETYTGPDGGKVVVQTWWQRAGDDAYDSYVVEKYADGRVSERQVRYRKTED